MGNSRTLFHPSAWKRTLGRKKGNRASAWSTADEATMPRACLPIRNHSSFFGSLCSPQCLPPPAFTPLPPNHPHCQSSQLSLSKDNSWSSGATVVRTSLYQVLLFGAGEGVENSVLASLCFQMLPRVFKQLFFKLWSLRVDSTSSPHHHRVAGAPTSAFSWKRTDLLFRLSYSYFECLSLTSGRIK